MDFLDSNSLLLILVVCVLLLCMPYVCIVSLCVFACINTCALDILKTCFIDEPQIDKSLSSV